MATKIYAATSYMGGASGSLDSIVYSTLADGDYAFVVDTGEDFGILRFESSSSAAEDSPKIVKPDDAGANAGRWILCDQVIDDLLVYGDLTVTGTLNLTGGLTPGGDLVFGDSEKISFDDILPSADHAVVGITAAYTAGQNLVFGDFCYYKTDGKMWKADADSEDSMPITAMAAATILTDASGDFLILGWARDDTWTWTGIGRNLYGSTTAGTITQTAPSGNDDIVQVVGIATHADRIYFKPDLTLIKVTA